MTRRKSGSRRGFFLVEIMVIIGMVGVIALISSELYIAMMRSHARLIEQQESQGRFDLALRQLRSDVWNASSVSVDEKRLLTVKRADGKQIRWTSETGLARTSDGQDEQHWKDLGTRLSLSVSGATVVLHEEPSQADPTGGRIVLPMVNASFAEGSR